MSSNQQPQQSSEEIDLGQLFQLIGNAFKKLFAFIASIFKGVFHVIMLFLLFIQKHFIKFVIAGVVGVGLGVYLDLRKQDIFVSSMVVEPNFNSVQQLYNNVSFYNELAKAQDSISLANALKITSSEAASIKKLEIESYSDENQKVLLFDKFIRELDSTTVKNLDFEAYLENFNTFDARFHKINLISTNSTVAKKAQPAIVKSISTNTYFKEQKATNDKNINFQEEIYNQQLNEIISLQELYKDVMVKEASKEIGGTNISLADNGNGTNKEIELLKERDELKQKIVALNLEKANKATILNVISDFPTRGAKLGGITNQYKFMLPILLVSVLLVLLLLLELNKILKGYSKK
ncbi:hypothetical protein KLA_04282 [Cellulophaga geojensis KL-A]|uniref:Lipopolysaccharide biosynthesis protein n=1 Tax=Cellulophaga geojensis KL-A TaxID=1328323 RepID=A0ABN0RRK8_9FLAO|nr:hypothetical protein [Cellulophaga geojensis]EWH14554.1 hypothetical protein KLA_04282 [Cellulophaga geojensis KL-A]